MPEPRYDGTVPEGLRRYTIYVGYPDCVEEIDLDAVNVKAAREEATELLRTDYEPGGNIIQIEERNGFYL